jgi:Family of unknown function (DUF6335)
MRGSMKARGARKRGRRRTTVSDTQANDVTTLADEVERHTETSPRLTGGDVDAAWDQAASVGDEAVGGSTATPDQDVVDELGAALGVAQEPDAEVVTTGEILGERDRHRWRIEREIALEEREGEEA